MADKVFDAIIIGSGANGGWAAMELTQAGMEVCMLEAGRRLDPEKDYTEHTPPWDLKFRNKSAHAGLFERRPVQSTSLECDEYNQHFFVDDIENPYTTAEKKPFVWIRGRHVGGRTIMWGRQSYRYSDLDFKAASHDGYGDDWPISYADLEPYYDKVEKFIGVSGSKEGLPQLPDGHFLPPMGMDCSEKMLKTKVDAMGRRLTIGRTAILTRNHQGRPACHYCGPCGRGCRTGSFFSTPSATLPAAEATGKLTLRTNAVVRHITTDDKGLASGVFFYDSITKQSEELKAKIIILAASTIESTRILFNSKNDQYPNGLGNSSGVLGHYLMDHIMGPGATGVFPTLARRRREDAERPNGIYIPRFRNVRDKQGSFIRGYGYQGGANVTVAEQAVTMPGFGADFKKRVKEETQTSVILAGFGEMLPNFENKVTLDDSVRDAWDIPAARIECRTGDNERAMAKDMMEQAKEMLTAAGAEITGSMTFFPPPGFAIHECGTARMGADPKTSFLNSFNQSHDVKNLFVCDGSAFVSIANQNPTLTMMSLTSRACEYLVEEHRRGNLA